MRQLVTHRTVQFPLSLIWILSPPREYKCLFLFVLNSFAYNIILLLLAACRSTTNGYQSSVSSFFSSTRPRHGGSNVDTMVDSAPPSKKSCGAKYKQMTLCGGVITHLQARAQLDIAIADFIHSNLLSFSIAGCPKFQRILDLAGQVIGQGYKPPDCHDIAGSLLTQLYKESWDVQIKSLLTESKLFGVTVFGDGATIKSVPLVNVLAAGVNNPFALLDVADCTGRATQAKKKDASYIVSLVDPLILKLENEVDANTLRHTGIVDLVYFDGAKNVQNAGLILAAKYPPITVGHGAEHVVSLFFSDVFNHTKEYNTLSKFTRFVVIFGEEWDMCHLQFSRNIVGSTMEESTWDLSSLWSAVWLGST